MTMTQNKTIWKRTPVLSAILLTAVAFQVATLPNLLLKISRNGNNTIISPQSPWWFPILTTSKTTTCRRAPLPPPKVFNDTPTLPPLHSSGPHPFLHDSHTNNSHLQIPPTLHQFHNVCLTQHYLSPTLRGLVYLVPRNHTSLTNGNDNDNNPRHCIPCSAPLNHPGGWNGTHKNEAEVGHKCGYVGIHAMFATDISDWSECINRVESQRKLKAWAQFQIPARAEVVKFYEGVRVMNLAFDRNIGHDMWDHLLTYLPHWYEFRFGGGGDNFPMDGVISHNFRNCIGGSHVDYNIDDNGIDLDNDHGGNPYWYCQILRAIDAFGGAGEISLPDAMDPRMNSTLHCFENLLTLRLSWPRNHGYSMDSMPNKTVFDAFRDVLFDKFDMPRHHRRSIRGSGETSEEAQDATGEGHLTISRSGNSNDDSSNNQPRRKILLYAHEPSARRVWTNMNSLLGNYQNNTKNNHNVIFQTIHDFGNHTVREQALLFNDADAMIMVHGAQMANSIFSVEGTMFVELGCRIPIFLRSQTYLTLIGAEYLGVVACAKEENREEKVACLDCAKDVKDYTYSNFTMSQESFDAMLEHVMSILN